MFMSGEIGYPTRPTQGEEMVSTTKPEMKPVTFEPAGTDGPPAKDVKCGMRRGEGECIKDGRIVNGQEAGVRIRKTTIAYDYYHSYSSV